jgi:ankyrin repeat protein
MLYEASIMKLVSLFSGLFASCACACILNFPGRAGFASSEVVTQADLMAAIRNGDTAAVKVLLRRGANVNVRDEDAATALMHAAADADLAMTQLLLQAGADVKASSKNGSTALQWALHDAEKVRLLLKAGAGDLDPAVLSAAGIPAATAVLKLLAEHGANLRTSNAGFTPLMAACGGGDLESVRYLVDHGGDVRARTPRGYTALYAAASWPGNVAIIDLLLEKGADPNAAVTVTQPVNERYTPLLAAAIRRDAASLKLLLKKGAKVDNPAGDYGRSPLLAAATTGRTPAVELLLASGADVNVRDALGNSALQWARRRGDTAIVQLLQKAGASNSPIPSKAEKPALLHTTLDRHSLN